MSKKLRPPEALIRAAQEVVEKAEAAGIDVALVGGLALNLAGSTRLTSDIDFVASGAHPEWYASDRKLPFGGDALVGPDEIPTDWIVRSDEYQALYEEALGTAGVDKGTGLPVALPEYIGAMKMAAGRKKDDADLEWLLSQDWFDRALFKRIVKEHLGTFAARELPQMFQIVDWKKQEGEL